MPEADQIRAVAANERLACKRFFQLADAHLRLLRPIGRMNADEVRKGLRIKNIVRAKARLHARNRQKQLLRRAAQPGRSLIQAGKELRLVDWL